MQQSCYSFHRRSTWSEPQKPAVAETLQTVLVMIISRNKQHHLFLSLIFPYNGICRTGLENTAVFHALSTLLRTPKLHIIPSVLYPSNFNSNFTSSALPDCPELLPDQTSPLLQSWQKFGGLSGNIPFARTHKNLKGEKKTSSTFRLFLINP